LGFIHQKEKKNKKKEKSFADQTFRVENMIVDYRTSNWIKPCAKNVSSEIWQHFGKALLWFLRNAEEPSGSSRGLSPDILEFFEKL
jgi:hypothetical protein